MTVPGATNGHGDEVEALGLKATVAAHLSEIDAREINSIPLGDGTDGEPIVARVGRYGPYLQRGEDRASIPDDIAPDELTIERAEEILAAPSNDRVLGTDPDSGLDVLVKAGRFGPTSRWARSPRAGRSRAPPRCSRPWTRRRSRSNRRSSSCASRGRSGRTPTRVRTSWPTTGGSAPMSSAGPTRAASMSEDQLLTVTLDEARALFAQPKQRRGRAAAPPLRELGTDPTTNLPVVVKEGRFGPYVTDGTTNASLRKGDAVESIDMDRASELLAERRAAGPSTRKKKAAKKAAPAKKKATGKKATAKKAAAKKAAKKIPGTKKAAVGSTAAPPDPSAPAAMKAAPTDPF